MRQYTMQSTVATSRGTDILDKSLLKGSFAAQVIVFLALHVVLGFVMRASHIVVILHTLVVLGLGAMWAIEPRHQYRLIYLVGYCVTAEMVWRMAGGSIFWEIGKYSVIFLLGLSLLIQRQFSKVNVFPLFYFLFMLPSGIQTLGTMSPASGVGGPGVLDLPSFYLGFNRELVAFSLAGPFALATAAIYFHGVTFTRSQMVRLLIAILAPSVSVLALAMFSTLTAGSGSFYFGSNFITSGESGPNQVSAILGLGALTAFFLAWLLSGYPFLRLLVGILAATMMVQAILTFSRGGVWTAAASMLVALSYLVRDSRLRRTVILGSFVVAIALYFLVLPRLNDYTGGELTERFSSIYTTWRTNIVERDMNLFQEHPLFGVGPGQAYTYPVPGHSGRDYSHTEYTRVLAEHGLLGAVSLAILALMALQRFFAKMPPMSKAVVASCTVWALIFMTHSATRLVAPSFLFGLGAATFLLESENESRSPAPTALGDA